MVLRRELEVGCTVDVRPRRERRTCSIVHVVTEVYCACFDFLGLHSDFFFLFFGGKGASAVSCLSMPVMPEAGL